MGFVVLAQRTKIEEKRIKVLKTWLEPKLVWYLGVLGFANFYKTCIKNLNRIIAPFILILQITESSDDRT